MYKKSTCKIAILMKFYYDLYSDEGLSLHFETLYCIYLYITHEYSHILLEYSHILHNFLFKNLIL